MNDFKDICEGLLGDIEQNIKNSDAAAKDIAQVQANKKYLSLVNDIYDAQAAKFSGGARTTDMHSTKISQGDIVVFDNGDFNEPILLVGIVASELRKDNTFLVLTGLLNPIVVDKNSKDPYKEAMQHDVEGDKLFVIAKKANAEKLLKIIYKVY